MLLFNIVFSVVYSWWYQRKKQKQRESDYEWCRRWNDVNGAKTNNDD